jgi:hypothetical protein
MRVFFSGLCAFAGWRADGASENPVQVILTKSGGTSPHEPMIALSSHFVLDARRNDGTPALADFAFLGPHGAEFLAWKLPHKLTIPVEEGPLTLSGTDMLIDLTTLCKEGGVQEPVFTPTRDNVAVSLTIATGTLSASIRCEDLQPQWLFVANDEHGDRRTIAVGPAVPPTPITIADQVEYFIGTPAPEGLPIEFGEPDDQSSTIRLRVNQVADVFVTNLSRLSQRMREDVPEPPGEDDHLSDVLMHYTLFANPPREDRRYVPILTGEAPPAQDSSCCVREMVRI